MKVGDVFRSVDFMSAPVYPLPLWATVPVQIMKKDGEEIEVQGVRYVQVKGKSCNYCVARPYGPDAELCDIICPYCKVNFVFARRSQ